MKKIDELIEAIDRTGAPIALGLDTRIEYLPDELARRANDPDSASASILTFNTKILKACRDVVPSIKIQIACYELLGISGMRCLIDTINAAKSMGYIVIVDAKRGDIGSTAAAYSAAYLNQNAPFQADFLTVNPYFGIDGVAPFIDDCRKTGRGIFVLVKTSNPSSGEFQDVKTEDGRALFEIVGEKVSSWGDDASLIGEHGYSSVGAVVGATYPSQGTSLRKAMPKTFFLVPGYGAQGATADDLAGCFDESGGGAVVNASRSIICAYKKHGGGFDTAARDEAERMRDDIARAIEKKRKEK